MLRGASRARVTAPSATPFPLDGVVRVENAACVIRVVAVFIQCVSTSSEATRVIMSEAEAAAPVAASPKKAAKSAAAAKKPRAKPAHPKTADMVNGAIKNLKERGGSSLQAIKKYVSANYKVDAEKLSPFIKKYLKGAVATGALVQTKGKGASGSFKLANKEKAEKTEKKPKAAAVKKPKVAKKPAAAAKKPAEKKTKVTKKPAAAAKKPAAAAAAPKKVKSPSKAKKATKAPAAKKPKAPKPKKAAPAKPKAAKRAAPKKK